MNADVARSLRAISTLAALAGVAAQPTAAHAESVTLATTTLTGAGPNSCSVTVAIYPTRVSGIVYYRQANDTIRAVNLNVLDFQVRANTGDKSKIKIANKVGTITTAPGTFTEANKQPMSVTVDVTADANNNRVDIVVKDATGAVLKTISGSPNSDRIRVQWTP